MKVALVTAVWQRHVLTAVFWRWAAHLRSWWEGHAEIVLIGVGSADSAHEALARDAGAIYGDCPNLPLGRKWNAALKLARQQGVDAVFIMGSDDVFCQRTAAAYLPYLDGTPYVGLRDFYYYQTLDGRAGYFPGYRKVERVQEPTGSGRLIPVDVLRRLGWELWSERAYVLRDAKRHHLRVLRKQRAKFAAQGVDHYSFKRLAVVAPPCPLLTLRDFGGVAVSLKGQGNLWQFEHVRPRPLPDGDTPENVLARLPEDVQAGIRALRPAEVA